MCAGMGAGMGVVWGVGGGGGERLPWSAKVMGMKAGADPSRAAMCQRRAGAVPMAGRVGVGVVVGGLAGAKTSAGRSGCGARVHWATW
jgi:hypothetical protein